MSNEQLKQEAIQLIVKAISVEVNSASQRSAKEMIDKYAGYINSKQELTKALEIAFITGATYVLNRIRQ